MTFVCSNCSTKVSPFAEACACCGQQLHPLTRAEVRELKQQHESQWSRRGVVASVGLDRTDALAAVAED